MTDTTKPTADEMLDWMERYTSDTGTYEDGTWYAFPMGVSYPATGRGETLRDAIADAMRKEAARAD